MRRPFNSLSVDAKVKAAEVYALSRYNVESAIYHARSCLSVAARTDRREMWIDVIAALPYIHRAEMTAQKEQESVTLGNLLNIPNC